LDGAHKHSEINMIAPKALNYHGLVMGKKEVKQINIVYPEVSKTLLTVDAKLNEDGTFDGTFKDRDTKLYAMVANERFTSDADKYAKSYKENYKFSLSNMKHGLQPNNEFESSFDFSSDTFVDVIGGKIVFNPLLFLYTQNHDFKQTTPRKAPLEFYSANDRIKKVTITLPENYVFENVPKSKKFRTEDNALQYTYLVTQEGNKLTVETITQIDDAMFPREYYPAFTQIFDNITKQEAQEAYLDATSVTRSLKPAIQEAVAARDDMLKDRFNYVSKNLNPDAQYVVMGKHGAVAPAAIGQGSFLIAGLVVLLGAIGGVVYIKTQWQVGSAKELGDRLRERGAKRKEMLERSTSATLVRTFSENAETVVKSNVELVRRPSQQMGAHFQESFKGVVKENRP
jgi:hypothetical protein